MKSTKCGVAVVQIYCMCQTSHSLSAYLCRFCLKRVRTCYPMTQDQCDILLATVNLPQAPNSQPEWEGTNSLVDWSLTAQAVMQAQVYAFIDRCANCYTTEATDDAVSLFSSQVYFPENI